MLNKYSDSDSIYYAVCCILCTRTEINELLTTFCCVFNNNTN